MTDTRHLLQLLYHTNKNNSTELFQMLRQQLYLHPHISTLLCPPVIVRGQQGPMHSHSHSMMTLPRSHPCYKLKPLK